MPAFCVPGSSIICPELCVLWVVPLLAAAPCSWVLPAYQGSAAGWPVGHVSALHRVRLALWSILQPVIMPQPRPAVARLEDLLQKVKNCEDVLPSDISSNQVSQEQTNLFLFCGNFCLFCLKKRGWERQRYSHCMWNILCSIVLKSDRIQPSM